MKFLAELEDALRESPGLAEKVLPLARPGVLLEKKFEAFQVERKPLFGLFKQSPQLKRRGRSVAPGASRLGGLPEVPKGQRWPMRDGRPMQFLAQFNCAELAEFREHTLLPSEGTLHFFLLENDIESLVTMAPAGVPLETALAPAGTPPEFVLPQFPLTFLLIPTIPHPESKEFETLALSEEDAELVLNAHGEIVEKFRREQHGLHQIGGYPEAVQGDVLTECEMNESRKYPGSTRKHWEEAAEKACHWRLLFQFDTDGDMDVMWGDAGTIYFCMREDDLRACRFEKVCTTGQCG